VFERLLFANRVLRKIFGPDMKHLGLIGRKEHKTEKSSHHSVILTDRYRQHYQIMYKQHINKR